MIKYGADMTSDEIRAERLARDPKELALRVIRQDKVIRALVNTLDHSQRAAVMRASTAGEDVA